MHKLKIDTHGNILIQYSSGEADPAHNTVVEGFTWLESEDALDTTMQYWNGSAWATKTERPNIWSVWASGAWTESEDLKAPAQGQVNIKLKIHRENLLYACDWTQIADTPLTDDKKAEWATYRTALRDFPATNTPPATDFDDLIWPTKPS